MRAQIARLTQGFERPADYFVRELAEGVGTIAAAFYPKPVIVRLSDFKTNEYASLLGGRWFEPHEENPMIGFRGASRYAHPAYAEGFALECAAMKRVREQMGLANVKLMIPFCRRVDEAERVLQAMAANGLERGVNGLEIYVMCEIPNNVIQIDAFARLFDGFSIGSNDLTQLVLGVDRDSELVAFDFDERDEGVKALIRQAIEGARRNDRHVGICGQAPSDYPEMTAVPGRAGYRFDQRHARHAACSDAGSAGRRAAAGSPAARQQRVARIFMTENISSLMEPQVFCVDMDDTLDEIERLFTSKGLLGSGARFGSRRAHRARCDLRLRPGQVSCPGRRSGFRAGLAAVHLQADLRDSGHVDQRGGAPDGGTQDPSRRGDQDDGIVGVVSSLDFVRTYAGEPNGG